MTRERDESLEGRVEALSEELAEALPLEPDSVPSRLRRAHIHRLYGNLQELIAQQLEASSPAPSSVGDNSLLAIARKRPLEEVRFPRWLTLETDRTAHRNLWRALDREVARLQKSGRARAIQSKRVYTNQIRDVAIIKCAVELGTEKAAEVWDKLSKGHEINLQLEGKAVSVMFEGADGKLEASFFSESGLVDLRPPRPISRRTFVANFNKGLRR